MCIILFDIDGTLTQSTKVIESDMIDILQKLVKIPNIKLGIVSGGTYTKIKYQLEPVFNLFTYIFAENCAVVYENDIKVKEINMKDYCDMVELNNLISKANEIILKCNDLPKHTKKFDMRVGLLYISIPGIDATDNERKNFLIYDEKNHIKKSILEELKKLDKNNNFNILYGGQVGIQVSPKYIDKSLAVEYFKNDEDIYFFGDRTEPDGNDYPIYIHPNVKGFSVKNPLDTIYQLKNLFNI